jgi:hypothetical protein
MWRKRKERFWSRVQLTLHSDPPLTKFSLDLKEKITEAQVVINWTVSIEIGQTKIIWWGPKG